MSSFFSLITCCFMKPDKNLESNEIDVDKLMEVTGPDTKENKQIGNKKEFNFKDSTVSKIEEENKSVTDHIESNTISYIAKKTFGTENLFKDTIKYNYIDAINSINHSSSSNSSSSYDFSSQDNQDLEKSIEKSVKYSANKTEKNSVSTKKKLFSEKVLASNLRKSIYSSPESKMINKNVTLKKEKILNFDTKLEKFDTKEELSKIKKKELKENESIKFKNVSKMSKFSFK